MRGDFQKIQEGEKHVEGEGLKTLPCTTVLLGANRVFERA
jgi:hypothetical protein